MNCIKNCEKKPLLVGEYTKFTLAGISIFRISKGNQNLIEKKNRLVRKIKNGVKITVFDRGKVNDVCFELSEGSGEKSRVSEKSLSELSSYLAAV